MSNNASKTVNTEKPETIATLQDKLMEIHHLYVYEISKLKFVANTFEAVVDDFCMDCPDVSGLSLLLNDFVFSLGEINDKLDLARYHTDEVQP